jgi:transketolase
MPSWELFEESSQNYKDRVLPPDADARVAVEAGIAMGWERYVGNPNAIVSINRFGASAPGGTVMEKFGFTVENVVNKALEILKK